MEKVKIVPANGSITVSVKVNSLQVVGITITIIASDGDTQLEYYTSDSNTNNPYTVTLPNPPDKYVGCYVIGGFTIIDPVGSGNEYSIHFSIQQKGTDLLPAIDISGTSTNTNVSRSDTFQIET